MNALLNLQLLLSSYHCAYSGNLKEILRKTREPNSQKLFLHVMKFFMNNKLIN